MASAGQAHAHSSHPMHFSSPSGHRLSWWWPWNRGAVGFLTSGYSTVSTFRNISVKVTPKPLIGLRNSSTCDLPGGGFPGRGLIVEVDAVVVRQVERRDREGARAHRHIPARRMMITRTTPPTTYGIVSCVSCRQARTVAVSRIQTMETGIRIFQPIAISWS